MTNDQQPQQPPRLKLYGTLGSPAAYAIRDFLTRSDVPFEWVELKTPEQAREIGINDIDDRRLPVCVFFDGTRVENPTIRQIIEKLEGFRDPSCSEKDVASYGASPAGLSAA